MLSKYKTEEERKEARRIANRLYRKRHPEIGRAYRLRNKERLKPYYREYSKARREEKRSHVNQVDRARRKRDPEKYRAKDRQTYKASKERIQALRKKNPLLIAARTKANNSIRDKRLKRDKCIACENIGEAHHSDYTKPLEITWLCKLHHAAWHRLFEPNYGTEKAGETPCVR